MVVMMVVVVVVMAVVVMVWWQCSNDGGEPSLLPDNNFKHFVLQEVLVQTLCAEREEAECAKYLKADTRTIA